MFPTKVVAAHQGRVSFLKVQEWAGDHGGNYPVHLAGGRLKATEEITVSYIRESLWNVLPSDIGEAGKEKKIQREIKTRSLAAYAAIIYYSIETISGSRSTHIPGFPANH